MNMNMGTHRHALKVSGLTMLGMALLAIPFFGGFRAGTQYEAGVQAQQVRQVLDTERQVLDLVVRRNPAATIRDFAGFPGHLIAEAERHRIDFRLVLALIDHESAFDPRAVGARGEVGLMQVLPATGQAVWAKLSEGALWEPPARAKAGGYASLGTLGDPRLNVTIGLTHLAGLRDEFRGMGPAALRAYNRGSSHAREDRPRDQYAERVALKFVRVAHEIAGR